MTDDLRIRSPLGPRITRRRLGAAAGAALALPLAAKLAWDQFEGFRSARVFVARASGYDTDLRSTLRAALHELGISASAFRGKSVLLKPNLIEPATPSQAVATHPAVVHAAAEVFLGWGAHPVMIGDGPGHCRDLYLVAELAGLKPVLKDLKAKLVDLNHDRVVVRRNALGFTNLGRFYVAATVAEADVVVSLAKLKTHHWAGLTLSMKNMFGILPGICYGWPKNVLHGVGIHPSILDVNATVRPTLAIIDGIVGMEGDGPIMGKPRELGALVVGTDPVATDATATRLVGADPADVDYLAGAAGRLGPIREDHIEQRGEAIARLQTTFALPEAALRGRRSSYES